MAPFTVPGGGWGCVWGGWGVGVGGVGVGGIKLAPHLEPQFHRKSIQWSYNVRLSGSNYNSVKCSGTTVVCHSYYIAPDGCHVPVTLCFALHDDVIKWKKIPCYWPFVREIHRSPVYSPHKGQWRGALVFSLICVSINGWVNDREAGDLRRHLAHYDVIVMRTDIPTWLPENHTIIRLFEFVSFVVRN